MRKMFKCEDGTLLSVDDIVAVTGRGEACVVYLEHVSQVLSTGNDRYHPFEGYFQVSANDYKRLLALYEESGRVL